MKVYIASSWRNERQPHFVVLLQEAGYEVYDFRNPHLGPGLRGVGFQWDEVDPQWKRWTPEGFRDGLKAQRAVDGFGADKAGMDWADVCVLVLPSGRSSHLEAGYMAGAGKPVHVRLDDAGVIPELMYGLLTSLCVNDNELLDALEREDGAPC